MVRREVSIDPLAMGGLVRVALERLQRQEVHRLKAHSSQAQNLRQILADARVEGIPVVEDPRANPGTLVFETNYGKFDASFDTQLAEIERGLTDRISQ